MDLVIDLDSVPIELWHRDFPDSGMLDILARSIRRWEMRKRKPEHRRDRLP
jgi:hypothetical protein